MYKTFEIKSLTGDRLILIYVIGCSTLLHNIVSSFKLYFFFMVYVHIQVGKVHIKRMLNIF